MPSRQINRPIFENGEGKAETDPVSDPELENSEALELNAAR